MNPRRLRQACMLALVYACSAQSGFAQDTSKANSADAQFKAMDSNGDGKVSPEEHATGAKKMFETMDANKDSGDGILTAEGHAAGSRMMFGRMDTSRDGFLSKAEMEAGHAKLMAKKETR